MQYGRNKEEDRLAQVNLALVCIVRRLVNIVYGMMKNKMEYLPFVAEDHVVEKQ